MQKNCSYVPTRMPVSKKNRANRRLVKVAINYTGRFLGMDDVRLEIQNMWKPRITVEPKLYVLIQGVRHVFKMNRTK